MTTLIEERPTKLSEFKAIKDQDKIDLEAFIEQQFTDVWFDARNGVHLVKKGGQIVPDKGYLKGLEYPLGKWTGDDNSKSHIRKLDARIKRLKSIQYHGPIAGRKTGDIVQGLPRIEEILEARKPKEPCRLAQRPGRLKLHYNSDDTNIVKITETNGYISEYTLQSSQKFIVSNGDCLALAEPLTDGAPNPHEMLGIFFNFYKNILILEL